MHYSTCTHMPPTDLSHLILRFLRCFARFVVKHDFVLRGRSKLYSRVLIEFVKVKFVTDFPHRS